MAKAASTQTGDYSQITAAVLQEEDGSVTFVDEATPSTDAKVVSQSVPDIATEAKTMVVVAQSETGRCYYARDTGDVAEYAVVWSPPGGCLASDAAAIPPAEWLPNW